MDFLPRLKHRGMRSPGPGRETRYQMQGSTVFRRAAARVAVLPGGRWLLLLVSSALLAGVLEAVRLPAALLLGPMLGGIIAAASGLPVRIPRLAFLAAQALIGCLMAHSITPPIVGTVAADWPLFLATIFTVIAVSAGLGWLLTAWRVLPGTVAVWGSSPGAATAMIVMAGEHGADARLVAFMHYLRVLMVTGAASVVARLWSAASTASGPMPQPSWWAMPGPGTLVALAIAAAGVLATLARVPLGALLLPLVIGAALQGSGLVDLELPQPLLAVSFAIIGWNVGLGFTTDILGHAARAFSRVLAAILVQIGLCAGLAVALSRFAGIEPLTAYLATSPGGADSVTIIAASSHVDMPFVMALQTLRLVIIMLTGPGLARFVAARTDTTDRPR